MKEMQLRDEKGRFIGKRVAYLDLDDKRMVSMSPQYVPTITARCTTNVCIDLDSFNKILIKLDNKEYKVDVKKLIQFFKDNKIISLNIPLLRDEKGRFVKRND